VTVLNEICQTCNTEPAVRLIGSIAYCHTCAEAVLGPIRERVILDEGGIGTGQQTGPTRPDWGVGFADLQCGLCQATWVGLIGEPCSWCTARTDSLLEASRAALLHPARDHTSTTAKRADWAHRLAGAVKEQVITAHEARQAWDREVARDRRPAA